MTRHQIREAVFLLTFEKIFREETPSELIAVVKENEVFEVNAEVERLFCGVVEHQEELDVLIEPYLKNWALQRISKIALAVLRVAVYEIKFCDDVDTDVAISEAVILTQTYAMKDDVNFVNGILGAMARGA